MNTSTICSTTCWICGRLPSPHHPERLQVPGVDEGALPVALDGDELLQRHAREVGVKAGRPPMGADAHVEVAGEPRAADRHATLPQAFLDGRLESVARQAGRIDLRRQVLDEHVDLAQVDEILPLVVALRQTGCGAEEGEEERSGEGRFVGRLASLSEPPGRLSRARRTSGTQAERRVAVGDEQKRVGLDTQRPPRHADHEVEDPSRVAAGEQDREPGDDDEHQGEQRQHREHDVVR